jgi:AbiV family abortive infection protein
MGKQARKRSYRNSLDFVEDGFRACWKNCLDLVAASKQLLDGGIHATALSISVLALEELAKLCAMDGLLTARHDDEKAELFSKSTRSHSVKLAILEGFPLLIASISRVDPRHGKDKAYHETLAISVRQLRDNGNAVMDRLDTDGFFDLNTKKQQGFYVGVESGVPIAPRDAVEPDMAESVCQLAWRATTTIDFVLKDGNLERYIRSFQSIRNSLSDADHQRLEQFGEQQFQMIFRRSNTEPEPN